MKVMISVHRCATPRSARLARVATIGVVLSVVVPNVAAAQQSQGASGTVLRLIRVVPAAGGGATTVVLEADGPLPEPASDALDGPPRVYFDLTGVTPGATLARIGRDALIVRTRVARHSENPVVTRVVLDLSRASPYRIDAAARAQGRLLVVLGGAGSVPPRPPALPTPGAAPRAKPPAPSPRAPLAGSSARARGPAGNGQVYAAQLSAVVQRLQALRPVLVSIDRYTDVPDDLTSAAAEFDAIGHILSAIKPPASREATHGLLVRVCGLGARSARTLQESTRNGDVAGQRNASSAAAGALILLDRAIKDLGL
jgi:hypothetical protein